MTTKLLISKKAAPFQNAKEIEVNALNLNDVLQKADIDEILMLTNGPSALITIQEPKGYFAVHYLDCISNTWFTISLKETHDMADFETMLDVTNYYLNNYRMSDKYAWKKVSGPPAS